MTDLVPSVTWADVAQQARVLGEPGFADQLEAADEDTLRRAFDKMARTPPKDVRRFESLDKERREGLLKGLLRLWREGDQDLAQTAGGMRLVMQSAPVSQPWQRPAFQRGNTLAMRHGADSARIIAAELPAVVAEIESELWDEYSVESPMGPPPGLDRLLVERLARGIVRLRRMDAYFDEADLLDAAGNPRPGVHTYQRLEGQVLRMMADLGIGPGARARLMADRAAGARDAALAANEAEAHLQARYGRPRVVDGE